MSRFSCKRGRVIENGSADVSPDAVLAAAGLALGEAILASIESWAECQMVSRGGPGLAGEGRAAGALIGAHIAPQLAALLAADVDEQRGTPLTILRAAHGPLTELLGAHGISHVGRDASEIAAQPDDVYGLGPRTFADLGPEVHEAGIRWGVSKAFAHRARHRGRA